jgi:hypothetical protein
MTNWERRVDRGLGYLGLFLIGSISWLADHIGRVSVTTTANAAGPRPRIVAARGSGSARTVSGPHPGQRAA